MNGWRIFTFSLRNVFGNLRVAIRVSALLFVVQIVVSLASGIALGPQYQSSATGASTEAVAIGALFLKALPGLAVAIIAYLWTAVAWHRYVLTGEASPSLIPHFEGRRMLAYFGVILLVIGILVVVAIFIMLVFGLLAHILGASSLGGTFSFLPLGIALLLSAPSLRLMTVLPGIALSAGHPLSEGWSATRGETATFYQIGVITLVFAMLIQGLVGALQSVFPLLAFGISIPLQWIEMMVGISVLTTLYGHYIERRALQ